MLKRIAALALALMLCLSAVPMPTTAADTNPFVDVATTSACYDAVMWALKNHVTTGIDDTHFQPFGHCTRGQVVTFLWRALGEPAPRTTASNFEDVDAAMYYYKPVLWAVEKGITTGTAANAFSPEDPCTVGQVLTFLWRALGEPSEPASGTRAEKLADNLYYKKAVAWADRSRLLDSSFSPESTAWRQEIVMYMHKALDQSAKVKYIRKVPSFTAYFGNVVGSWDHRTYDEFDVWEAKFETTYDVSCRMIENFHALVEKHGFNLTVQNETENSDAEHDYRAIWYTYDGPEANKVQPTSKGGNSHFSIFYTNNFGYSDPSRNYLEIRCCIGKGLDMLDTGERATWKLTPWVEKTTSADKTIPDPFIFMGVDAKDVKVNSRGEYTVRLKDAADRYMFLFKDYIKQLESGGFVTRFNEDTDRMAGAYKTYLYSATSNNSSVRDVGKVKDLPSDFYISMNTYLPTASEEGYTLISIGVSPDLTFVDGGTTQTRYDIAGSVKNKSEIGTSGLGITINAKAYVSPKAEAPANNNNNANANAGNNNNNANANDGLGAGDNNAAAAVGAGLNFTPYKCPICAGKTYISCSTCNGTGRREVWSGVKRQMETKTCDGGCNGTGRYSCGECKGDGIVEPADKDPANARKRCGYCIGTGQMPCPSCGGEGTWRTYNSFKRRMETDVCRGCGGSKGFSCPACKGDGWIDPGDPG